MPGSFARSACAPFLRAKTSIIAQGLAGARVLGRSSLALGVGWPVLGFSGRGRCRVVAARVCGLLELANSDKKYSQFKQTTNLESTHPASTPTAKPESSNPAPAAATQPRARAKNHPKTRPKLACTKPFNPLASANDNPPMG